MVFEAIMSIVLQNRNMYALYPVMMTDWECDLFHCPRVSSFHSSLSRTGNNVNDRSLTITAPKTSPCFDRVSHIDHTNLRFDKGKFSLPGRNTDFTTGNWDIDTHY